MAKGKCNADKAYRDELDRWHGELAIMWEAVGEIVERASLSGDGEYALTVGQRATLHVVGGLLTQQIERCPFPGFNSGR